MPIEIPSMITDFLPPSQVVDVTQQYSQNQLAPTNSGCPSCSQQQSYFRMDADSRRNLAGLKGLLKGAPLALGGVRGIGGAVKLATLGNVGRALGRVGLGEDPMPRPSGTATALWSLLSAASMGASAFHGYRRHRGSIGWAVVWALMGGLFPIVVPAIALAEGFGKPMKRGR